jgi:hypothetical protein
MRNLGIHAVGLCVLAALLGACSSDTQPPTSASSIVDASGSVVALPGDGVKLTSCTVKAGEIDLTPIWSGQPAGFAVAVIRDGKEIYRTPPAAEGETGEGAFSDVSVDIGTNYSYSVVAIGPGGTPGASTECGSAELVSDGPALRCSVSLSDSGLPEVRWENALVVQAVAVRRDGIEIATGATSPFIDETGAPQTAASYSILATDTTGQGRPAVSVECGSVAPTGGEDGSLDLAVAMERSNSFPSPYQYVVLAPVCPGCSGTAELYLVPSTDVPTAHVVDRVWIDGSQSSERGAVWMVDPLTVPALLLEALRAGRQVVYEIDQGTGLVRSWTIDGSGANYQCLEVDTRPIDMRASRCEANLFPG